MANTDNDPRSDRQIILAIERNLKKSEKFSAVVFGLAVVVIGLNFAQPALIAGNKFLAGISIFIIILGFIMSVFVGFFGKRFSIRQKRIFKTEL